MSLRDYFAAHAPPVPEWFRVQPDSPAPSYGHERSEWQRRLDKERFFVWRWYYATTMSNLARRIEALNMTEQSGTLC